MNKINFIFSLFIITILTLIGCSKNADEPSVDDKHKLLYDKWWYSIDSQDRGEEYFNSDGTCQMTIPPASGTWTWKANDSLKVDFVGYPSLILHFTILKQDTMEYWPTFEPLGIYYKFSTTKP